MRFALSNWFESSSKGVYTDSSKAVLLLWTFFAICVLCLSCFLSVHCSLVVTCWETGPMALLCVMFYCAFVTFPCGVLDQICCLIVSIPDICLLSFIQIFL